MCIADALSPKIGFGIKVATLFFLLALTLKVVTERQIVYLMGLVTQQEADEALQIVKTSQGVVKVKSFFEIDNKYKKN